MSKIIEKLLDTHNGEGNKTNGSCWRALRKAVLERDNYVCWQCGRKADTAHHKQYGKIDENDLISLCQKCHINLHGLELELQHHNHNHDYNHDHNHDHDYKYIIIFQDYTSLKISFKKNKHICLNTLIRMS